MFLHKQYTRNQLFNLLQKFTPRRESLGCAACVCGDIHCLLSNAVHSTVPVTVPTQLNYWNSMTDNKKDFML